MRLVKADASWAEESKDGEEDDFKPTLFNTVVYLIYSTILLSIFTVNYQGHPHMQSLYENKAMFYGISANWFLNILLTLGMNQPLNDTFELVALPHDIFIALIKLMLIDFFGTLAAEKTSSLLLQA